MNCWLILFQVKTKLGFGIFLPLRLEEGSLMFRDYRYVQGIMELQVWLCLPSD